MMAYTCLENVLYGVWDWKMPYRSEWEKESGLMKVAYFGECDYLTTNVLQRLRKEDYDVYVLSSDNIERKDLRWKGYHHYRLTGEKEEAERIFQAVNPDIVIYEGMAKWVEIQYLYLIGETNVARREEIITRNREDAYGLGFCLYEERYPLTREAMSCQETPFTPDRYPLV